MMVVMIIMIIIIIIPMKIMIIRIRGVQPAISSHGPCKSGVDHVVKT